MEVGNKRLCAQCFCNIFGFLKIKIHRWKNVRNYVTNTAKNIKNNVTNT